MMVVPDDKPPARRQPLAEFLLPPVHRPAHATDEQDRRVSRVASGVHAQVNAVDLDDPVAVHNHPHYSLAGRYRTFTADPGSLSPTRAERTRLPPAAADS